MAFKTYHTITLNLGICSNCANGLHLCQSSQGCQGCPECQRQRGFRIGFALWSLPALTGAIATFAQISSVITPNLPPVILGLSLLIYIRSALKLLKS